MPRARTLSVAGANLNRRPLRDLNPLSSIKRVFTTSQAPLRVLGKKLPGPLSPQAPTVRGISHERLNRDRYGQRIFA